jgi:dolichol-phosphate mannosyltransferase
MVIIDFDNNTDVVIASRFINGKGKNVLVYRKVGMKMLDTVTDFGGRINVSDTQSGFRAYGKKAIEKIRVNYTDISAGSEILMQIKDQNLEYKEVEIDCNYDVGNTSSQYPVNHRVKVLIWILKDIELRRPLFFFSMSGLVLMDIGLSMGINFLQMARSGIQVLYWPFIIMIIVTLISMFSTFIGLLLNSLSKLFIDLKKSWSIQYIRDYI